MRVLLATVALLATLPAVASANEIAFPRLPTIDWSPWQPVDRLIAAADRPDAVARNAALAELARRVPAGSLPRQVETDLVDKALAKQADVGTPWVSGWGSVIEAAHLANRLSPDRLDRYLAQAVEFTPVKVVATRTKLRFGVRWSPARLAPRSPLVEDVGGYMLYADKRFVIDGKEFDGFIQHPWAGHSGAYKADYHDMPKDAVLERICFIPTDPDDVLVEAIFDLTAWVRSKLVEGPQVVRVKLVLRYEESNPDPARPKAKTTVGRPVVLSIPWTLHPLAEEVAEPAHRAAVRAAVSVVGATYFPEPPPYGGWLAVDVTVREPPLDVAFEARVRLKGDERPQWLAWRVHCRAGRSDGPFKLWFTTPPGVTAADVASFELVLVPDPDSPLEMTRIWGEKLVIREVGIARTVEPKPKKVGRAPAEVRDWLRLE